MTSSHCQPGLLGTCPATPVPHSSPSPFRLSPHSQQQSSHRPWKGVLCGVTCHLNRYSSAPPPLAPVVLSRVGPPGRWPGPSVCGCLNPAYQKLLAACSFESLEAPLLSWLVSPLAMGLPTAWEPFLFFRSLLGIQVLSYFLFSPLALLVTWGSFLVFQVFEVFFSCSVGVL